MITEDYCSFELSKLLEEKGFDVELQCYSYDAITKENVDIYWQKNINGLLPRCTHQMAMKWLREEHKISIEIYCIPSYTEGLVVWRYMIRNCETCDEVDYPNGYPAQECLTFEEAVEAALKYTLENLIE